MELPAVDRENIRQLLQQCISGPTDVGQIRLPMMSDIAAKILYSGTDESLELAREESDRPGNSVSEDDVNSTMPSNHDRLLDGANNLMKGQIDNTNTSYAAKKICRCISVLRYWIDMNCI